MINALLLVKYSHFLSSDLNTKYQAEIQREGLLCLTSNWCGRSEVEFDVEQTR